MIANRAAEILGRRVHPNDQVNLGQSSNDVIPSVLHVSAVIEIERDLLPALERLRAALAEKAKVWDLVQPRRQSLPVCSRRRTPAEPSGAHPR